MKDFAHIRIVGGRQVLAYTSSTDDGHILNVMYRLKNGTEVNTLSEYKSKSDMTGAFVRFSAGEVDDVLGKNIAWMENNAKTKEDEDQLLELLPRQRHPSR